MLTGIHFLLTYSCNLTCDHCFLYCGPTSKGTMTLKQIAELLKESRKIGTVQETYFEGGEPFLFYPLLVEGVRLARESGFTAGIVSNGYWATCTEDAEMWLRPLVDLGISDLSVSDDDLHFGDRPNTPSKHALAAAQKLGMPALALCKARPEVKPSAVSELEKGTPEISGGIKLRGRAVEKLAAGLPKQKSAQLTTCPYEDLVDPKRLHVDAWGNVQVCQGISIGNCWKTPLSQLVGEYVAEKHPICGPLASGGPAQLADANNLELADEYVDECHMCYAARVELLTRFPQFLAPTQVYGIGDGR